MGRRLAFAGTSDPWSLHCKFDKVAEENKEMKLPLSFIIYHIVFGYGVCRLTHIYSSVIL